VRLLTEQVYDHMNALLHGDQKNFVGSEQQQQQQQQQTWKFAMVSWSCWWTELHLQEVLEQQILAWWSARRNR
jgi:hypothetical protein